MDTDNKIGAPLEHLPDEILHHITLLLPLQTLISLQESCSRFCKTADHPLIWRHQCITYYTHWHPKHQFQHAKQRPALEVGWKALFKLRKRTEQSIKREFEAALRGRQNRLAKLEAVVASGYDAKDFLLDQINVSAYADDYLSRTYWARMALGSIERATAIAEWQAVLDSGNTTMERTLGAIDCFVAQRPPESLEELTAHLDRIAAAFKLSVDRIEELSPRQMACEIGHFLQAQNLCGVRSPTSYYDLQNSLITVALCEDDHPSLPLISGAIYCSIANRMGLRASLLNFPDHIHVAVSAANDHSLDHHNPSSMVPASPNIMYIDPFSSSVEVTDPSRLRALAKFPIPPQSGDRDPCAIQAMLFRMAANIGAALNYAHRPARRPANHYPTVLNHPTNSYLPPSVNAVSPVTLDLHAAKFCLIILILLFGRGVAEHSFHFVTQSQIMHSLSHFELDVPLLYHTILPLIRRHNPGALRAAIAIFEELKSIRDTDNEVPSERHRIPTESGPKYRVGDYFRHKRYEYLAAITGWDDECRAGEQWIRSMDVERLPNGRGQPFYHVIVDDESERYVAEENIGLVLPPDPESGARGRIEPQPGVLRHAGRWFRRWDHDKARFAVGKGEGYDDDV